MWNCLLFVLRFSEMISSLRVTQRERRTNDSKKKIGDGWERYSEGHARQITKEMRGFIEIKKNTNMFLLEVINKVHYLRSEEHLMLATKFLLYFGILKKNRFWCFGKDRDIVWQQEIFSTTNTVTTGLILLHELVKHKPVEVLFQKLFPEIHFSMTFASCSVINKRTWSLQYY